MRFHLLSQLRLDFQPHEMSFNEFGNPREISTMFGGPDNLHDAIDHLGQHLFDVS